MTLNELEEYIINNVSEVDIVEILSLTSEDLVYRCRDIIENKFDKIIYDLELEVEKAEIDD